MSAPETTRKIFRPNMNQKKSENDIFYSYVEVRRGGGS